MANLTFANYLHLPGSHDARIYEIGSATPSHGVIPEMAAAFGHQLTVFPDTDNLVELVGVVGPAKELQANIGRVQEVLGTDDDAVTIARGWAERSGLLVPVERMFMSPDLFIPNNIDAAIITGGVRNWMMRRTERLVELMDDNEVDHVFLVGGNRQMKEAEGPDVEDGMKESDYLEDVIRPLLDSYDIDAVTMSYGSGVGDEVAYAGATAVRALLRGVDDKQIAVVSNAGAWVQNAGQIRRAFRSNDRDFDTFGDQLLVVSDSFQLGTGVEPTSTHQNPFSAAGQIVRNAQELTRD